MSLSARALAQAARRAGRIVATIDAFGDSDTVALSAGHETVPIDRSGRFDEPALCAATVRFPELRLVAGTGFEAAPGLLRRLAAARRLIGNPPEVIARVKDPFALATVLRLAEIPHPEIRRGLGKGDSPSDWLIKKKAGAGGGHVVPATGPGAAPPGAYFQRRVPGRLGSASFLADGRDAVVVGFAEPWLDPAPGQPFRFGGVAAPAEPPAALTGSVAEAIRRLVAATGLRGLGGVDFVVDGEAWSLLEVNPRPTASLDLFDRAPVPPLFDLHLAALAGVLPTELPRPAGARALATVYAALDHQVPAVVDWPGWVADRPRPGTVIPAGCPICTVSAGGENPAVARRRLAQRRRSLVQAWECAA